MVYRPSVDNRLCFVLMPFKEPFNSYYNQIIKGAVMEAGLDPLRGDEIYGTQAIIRDIWDQIWRAQIIIADVTDKNPNVNYELGLCHALGIPTILITKRIEDVPFDYRHRRSIVYNTEEAGWDRKLKESLKKTIEVAFKSLDDDELPWPYSPLAPAESASMGAILALSNPREVVIQGTKSVWKLIAKSLGPAGAYVSVKGGGQGEQVSQKRGLVISQGVQSTNPLEVRGIELIKLIADEVYKRVGDYTKTAILLAYSMLEHGNNALKRGYPPRYVIQGMKKAVDFAISELKAHAQPISNDAQLIQVAATAADDNQLGRLFGEAFAKVGRRGAITFEQVEASDTSLTFVDGLKLDSGYLSPYFVTDPEEMKVVLEKVRILLCEDVISSMKNLLPILEQLAKADTVFLIIAKDVEGEALATLVVNKLRGTLNVAAVKVPGFGEYQKGILEDLALYTGGQIVGKERGRALENVTFNDLGSAKKVIISVSDTNIFNGGGERAITEDYVNKLRAQILVSPDSERQALQEHIGRLTSGIPVIKIGGIIKFEVMDKKYKAESAFNSANSAIEEGWILGGGLTLFRISKAVQTLSAIDESDAAGIDTIAKALEDPIHRLIENSQVNLAQVLSDIDRSSNTSVGFNAVTRRVEDLLNAGIFDSTKGLRIALEIAFSHTKAILQTIEWDLRQTDESKPSNPSFSEN